MAPIVIARSVWRRGVIDVRTVMASLCIYVLLGMFWAFTYGGIGYIGTHPFFAQEDSATSAEYLYFSFITLTTVGYGDLTAAGNLGRSLAALEALLGQIYLVTIVATFVSRVSPRAVPNRDSAERCRKSIERLVMSSGGCGYDRGSERGRSCRGNGRRARAVASDRGGLLVVLVCVLVPVSILTVWLHYTCSTPINTLRRSPARR